MRHAFGFLGWSPETFWSATPIEFYCAMEGWQEANVGDNDSDEPFTMDELHDLMARFPD